MVRSSRYGILGCAAVLSCFLFSAPPAWAVDLKEWVPGLQVTTFLTERVEYDTNIFQFRRSDDDLIIKTIPGFVLDYSAGATTLSAAYRAEILKFLDHKNQDNTHHIASGQIRVELPRLTASLREDFTRTSDPPTTELVGRIESTTNALTPDLQYKLTERFSLGANGNWTYVHFPTIKVLDRNEYLVGGTAFWRVAPKAQVGLNYSHGWKEFQTSHKNNPNRDVTRDLILVRVLGDLTPKLSAQLNGGYEVRTAEGKNQPDAHFFTFGGSVTYRLTERTRFSLFVDRSAQESVFTDRNLFFITTSETLTVDQRITDKLSANARVTAVDNTYPTKANTALHPAFQFRHDNIYGWGAGLDYAIQKWLLVGADFSHTMRDSTFKEFNYKDDKITGRVTLQF